MHEGEEVTPSISSRKRRYKTSFRFSTMKELKKARVSKKKVVGIISVVEWLTASRRVSVVASRVAFYKAETEGLVFRE
jgi:hypothetical protein